MKVKLLLLACVFCATAQVTLAFSGPNKIDDALIVRPTSVASPPTSVSFPGDFGPSLATPIAVWDPAEASIAALDGDGDGVYTLVINTLPAGTYEFKAAIDGTLVVNYGVAGVLNGDNVKFTVPSDNAAVTLYFDIHTKITWPSSSDMPVLKASFMAASGYGADNDVTNLNGWMQQYEQLNKFQTFLHVPQGTWTYEIGFVADAGTVLRYKGTPFKYVITVKETGGQDVTFIYDAQTKSVYDSASRISSSSDVSLAALGDSSQPSWDISDPRPTTTATGLVVSFPGSYGSSLATPANNDDPADDAVQATDTNGIYKLDISTLPKGTYTFKAALDKAMTVNFGANSKQNGDPVSFQVAADNDQITLLFDRHHNFVASSNDKIPILVGDFVAAAGYGSNWDTTNLNMWMKDFLGEGKYSTSLMIPQGTWSFKIGMFGSSLESFAAGYAGSWFPYTINIASAGGEQVTFVYDDATKSVATTKFGSVPTPGIAALTHLDNSRPGWVNYSPRSKTALTGVVVGFPGDYVASLTPPGSSWAPADPAVQGTDPDGDGIYTLDINTLPKGEYQFKAALNGGWSLNYGAGSARDGPNVPLKISEDNEAVTLFYDSEHNHIASSLDVMPILVGDFMTAAGYGADWDPTNLNGWMKAFSADDVYSTSLLLPVGLWSFKVGRHGSTLEEFSVGLAGTPAKYTFEVTQADTQVTFVYVHKTKALMCSVATPITPPGIALLQYNDGDRPGFLLSDPRPTTGEAGVVIGFPGDYVASLSPPGSSWAPADPSVQGTDPDGDGVYTLDINTLPADNFQFKAALNGGWSVNYGKGSKRDGPNIPFRVPSDNFPLQLMYDRSHNYVASTLDVLPIVVSDFMSAASYGGNWNSSNLHGWMKAFSEDDMYSTTLQVPAGTWQYMVAFYDDTVKVNGFGGPLANSMRPITLTLSAPQAVTFLYHAGEGTVGDSVNGFTNRNCNVNCLNGGDCFESTCNCLNEYSGPRCELQTHFEATCLGTIPAGANGYDYCAFDCSPGYQGRECTLQNFTMPTGQCEDGWYGPNCLLQLPITGGSSMMLDLGQGRNPWAIPQHKPKRIETFPHTLLAELRVGGGEWGTFWDCKRTTAGELADPFRHMHTIESWVYLPEKAGSATEYASYINILTFCEFQFGINYKGDGNFQLHVLFGELSISALTMSTASGRFMAEGAAPWYSGTPNTWYHLALVMDYAGHSGDTITWTFYVNGEVQYRSVSNTSSRRSVDQPGSAFCKTNANDMRIGSGMAVGTERLEAQWTKLVFDELRMYTVAKTQTDIRKTMNRRILDDELEKRNTRIMPGMPELFVYFPLNEFDRLDGGIGSPGSHWAGPRNKARIVPSKEANRIEGDDSINQPYFELRTLGLSEKLLDGISLPENVASNAPVIGWEQEVHGVQDTTVDFELQAMVLERKLDFQSCSTSFQECLKQDPGQTEHVLRKGGEDLAYPPHVPVSSISDPSTIRAKVDSITYTGSRSGSLVFAADDTPVVLGQEYPITDMKLRFVPGAGQFSVAAAPQTEAIALDRFASLTYTVIDTRNLTQTAEVTPPVVGDVAIRIQRIPKPVVGEPSAALHCRGGPDSVEQATWAVADLDLDLTKDFTVELWVLAIQHKSSILGLQLELGGTVFNGGLNTASKPNMRLDFTLNNPVFFSYQDQINHQIGYGSKSYVSYKWFHMAFVVDAATNVVTTYVDGEQATSLSYTPVGDGQLKGFFLCDSVHPDQSWSATAVPQSWEGYVDEVRIWNTKRTPTQLRDWMFQELDFSIVDKSDLIAYWNFDEIDSELARDVSGNNHDMVFGNCDSELFVNPVSRQQSSCDTSSTSSTKFKASSSSTTYSLASRNARPFTEFPSIQSPVRVWRPSIATQVSDTTTFYLDGTLPLSLDCSEPNADIPEGRRRVCRVPPNGFPDMAIEIVALPDDQGVQIELDGSAITSTGKVLSAPGSITLVPTSNGAKGGNPFTSFSYRIRDELLGTTSVTQTVEVVLKCNEGHYLDSATKQCKVCAEGSYNQWKNVKNTCCTVGSGFEDGCALCPKSMMMMATNTTTVGTMSCVCRSSGDVFEPVDSLQKANAMENLCHVCSETNDLFANITSCDASTNLRTIQYSTLIPGCIPFDDSTVECTHVEGASTTGTVASIILSISTALNAMLVIWVFVSRKHVVIKHSQPTFVFLTALGSMLFNLSAFSLLGPNTNANCLIRVWSLNLSFTLMFAALFVKVWRVYKLFSNRKLQKMTISNANLWRLLLKVMFVEVLILTIWSFVSPSKATRVPIGERIIVRHNPEEFMHTICQSEYDIFSTIAVVFKVMVLLYGVSLSWETRNVDGRFSEAKYIAMAIFYMFSLGGLCFVASTTIASTSRAQVTFQVIGIALCTTVAMGLIFLPKLLLQIGLFKIHSSDFGSSLKRKTRHITPGETTGVATGDTSDQIPTAS